MTIRGTLTSICTINIRPTRFFARFAAIFYTDTAKVVIQLPIPTPPPLHLHKSCTFFFFFWQYNVTIRQINRTQRKGAFFSRIWLQVHKTSNFRHSLRHAQTFSLEESGPKKYTQNINTTANTSRLQQQQHCTTVETDHATAHCYYIKLQSTSVSGTAKHDSNSESDYHH